jgi:hypothetical protein
MMFTRSDPTLVLDDLKVIPSTILHETYKVISV